MRRSRYNRGGFYRRNRGGRRLNPNHIRIHINDAGLGGKLIGVGITVAVLSAVALVETGIPSLGIGVPLGIVIFVIGFIIMPSMKKDSVAAAKHNPMGIAIKCERCGLDLNHNIVTNSYSCLQCKSKRHCPTCRSELLFDEITHMHNCPYCHVGYKSEDLF